MNEWQLIKTAPHDGISRLLVHHDLVFIGHYSYDRWVSSWDFKPFTAYTPTHWMHLPDPPGVESND